MATVTIPKNELNSFDLPRICVMTAARQGVVFKKVKFAWYPKWVPLLVLINLVVAGIVAWALTRRVQGELPFTEEAFRAWRVGLALLGGSVVGSIALLFLALFLLGADQPWPALAAGLLMLGAPIGLWARFVRGKTIKVVEITQTHVTLDLPSQHAAFVIREHLFGGLAGREARTANE